MSIPKLASLSAERLLHTVGVWLLLSMFAVPSWAQPSASRPASSPRAGAPSGPEQKPDSAARSFRLSDRRQPIDPGPLAARGIRRHASKRLILFTDVIDPEVAQLPQLVDAAYDNLVTQLGELPPSRERDEFQVTGYLIRSQPLFREAGLLPDDLARFDHGRNRGYEFWLNEQPTPYYRAHLLLHEFTHCYTTVVRHGLLQTGWYMEGIAELFATHNLDKDGQFQFALIPQQRTQFPGLGRIRLIEEARRDGNLLSLTEVQQQPYERFLKPEAYAWSWALCQFLTGHPRYRAPFLEASHSVTTAGTDAKLRQLLSQPSLAREWEWFTRDLCHGYDQMLATINPPDKLPNSVSNSPAKGKSTRDSNANADSQPEDDRSNTPAGSLIIRAKGGWQLTPLDLTTQSPLTLEAFGRFQLQTEPQTWVSTAEGVSIRYHAGLPLGRLVGRIWPDDPQVPTPPDLDLGSRATVAPTISGRLYLRLNDAWNELADNQGEVRVSPTE